MLLWSWRGFLPLEDADRWPWLGKLASLIAGHEAAGRSSVIACSALKRAYRDKLREGAPRVRFLHLHGPREVLQARLDARKGHFFPPDLLASQFATLEPIGRVDTRLGFLGNTRDVTLWKCAQPRRSWSQVWPEWMHL